MSTRDQWEMICPSCASDESLAVEVKIFAALSEDGTEIHGGDQEWDDDSKCECCGCGWSGLVKDAKRAFKADPFDAFAATANAEGWGVFQSGDGEWSIQADSDSDNFADNMQAYKHVEDSAKAGSAPHIAALAFVNNS